jgi:protein-tyrosine phosphatase
MNEVCDVHAMATARPYTLIVKNLYMGAARAFDNPRLAHFDIYVSAAAEWNPPKSISGNYQSIHIPLKDAPWRFRRHKRELEKLVKTSAWIASQVRQGKKTFIYCNMGMNRSGLMTGLTLLQLGYPIDRVLRLIRKRHDCTLSNPSFEDALVYVANNMI